MRNDAWIDHICTARNISFRIYARRDIYADRNMSQTEYIKSDICTDRNMFSGSIRARFVADSSRVSARIGCGSVVGFGGLSRYADTVAQLVRVYQLDTTHIYGYYRVRVYRFLRVWARYINRNRYRIRYLNTLSVYVYRYMDVEKLIETRCMRLSHVGILS